MKRFYFISSCLTAFTLCLSFNLYAQFTGGSGSGFAYNTSVPQQISQTVYNDLSVLNISSPNNNDTLPVNTPFDLSFTLQNNGTYPVLPSHGVFVEVFLNGNSLLQQTYYLNQTLAADDQTVITLDSLLIADIGGYDLCIEVNGTTFATDTITANNGACSYITINDPTGIENFDNNTFRIYYDNLTQSLHILGNNKIISVSTYDFLGREYLSFIDFDSDFESAFIRLNHLKNGPYIVSIYTESFRQNVKFFKN